MKKSNKYFIGIIVFILFTPLLSFAQLSKSSTPKSFTQNLSLTVPAFSTGTVDVQQLLVEDDAEEKQGVPQRFGFPFDVNLNLTNSGSWQNFPDGSRIWTLSIVSTDAQSINLLYDNFWLPEGAELFIYNKDKSMVIGAFTSQNNKAHRQFATAPVQGDEIILELNLSPEVTYPGEISISRVVHAYRNIFEKMDKDYGSSGSCNNNVNCPEGDPWQDEINSVAMIILGSGFRWCSGSMINNVRQDLTPYFLTADHCLNSPSTFIFMFNYQSPTCSNINGPTTMTIQGSTLLASNGFSDFALLLLDETPPDSFNIFYSGWSNINTSATTSVGIHHPAGDIKKISFNDNPVSSTSYYSTSSGDNSHWRVDDWEDGTTEGGSSGSPLYDQNHRIIGQLHGGNASCGSITDDWYGKFSTSWDGSAASNRLRDWLDPDNTGTTTMDGIDANGLTFSADTIIGWVPMDVQFTASSIAPVDTWGWDFGDGFVDSVQNPFHSYNNPGVYDVRLDVSSEGIPSFRLKNNYIIALADTLTETDIESTPATQIIVTVNATNNLPLDKIIIPIEYAGNLGLTFDSMSTNSCRTENFEVVDFIHFDTWYSRMVVRIQASIANSEIELPVGSGSILKLYFNIDGAAQSSDTTILFMDGYTSGPNTYLPTFSGTLLEYQPEIHSGVITIVSSCCLGIAGNVDNDPLDNIDISDLVTLVDYMFQSGAEPDCIEEANIDGSIVEPLIDISDLVILVDYMFQSGAAPSSCP